LQKSGLNLKPDGNGQVKLAQIAEMPRRIFCAKKVNANKNGEIESEERCCGFLEIDKKIGSFFLFFRTFLAEGPAL
jgi:hypothetical protein